MRPSVVAATGGRPRGSPRGELGEEAREIAVTRLGGRAPAAREELAELEQVRAVGLERVAREAPLELQVGEEVEQQRARSRLRFARRSSRRRGIRPRRRRLERAALRERRAGGEAMRGDAMH